MRTVVCVKREQRRRLRTHPCMPLLEMRVEMWSYNLILLLRKPNTQVHGELLRPRVLDYHWMFTMPLKGQGGKVKEERKRRVQVR